MCRCQRSRWKCVWVRVRAPRNSGSRASSPAALCSRSMASRFRSPGRRFCWPPQSCRSRRALSSVSLNSCRGMDMEPEDLRRMTVDQLDDEALKLKKEQFNLRFQRATGQLENTGRVREVRRDIARVKTIAAQKRAAEAKK